MGTVVGSVSGSVSSVGASGRMALQLDSTWRLFWNDLVNKLASRGDMMIGRMVKQVEKNAANMAEKKPDDEGGDVATFQGYKPAGDAAGTTAGESVVAETDAKPKRKGGRPKKADGDKSAKKPRTKKADADKKAKPKAETPRQKRDREILEKMMEDNPNIK